MPMRMCARCCNIGADLRGALRPTKTCAIGCGCCQSSTAKTAGVAKRAGLPRFASGRVCHETQKLASERLRVSLLVEAHQHDTPRIHDGPLDELPVSRQGGEGFPVGHL